MIPSQHGDSTEALIPKTYELLRRAGTDCESEIGLTRLSGGANNGVFRVDSSEGRYVVKQYFSHPDDPRDRFRAETAFAGFLWRHGVRQVPQLLAADEVTRLALFQYVEGRPLSPVEVDESHVTQAADFCRMVFALRDRAGAGKLPVASEACFSVRDHLDRVAQRMEGLEAIPDRTASHAGTRCFVREELLPRWETVRRTTEERFAADRSRLVRQLDRESRVPSPSDFGFHNAILTPGGVLCFLDFEYAGWDDPAKLACDFFCQVDVPAPRSLMPRFVESIGEVVPDPAWFRERVECLFPVYLLKWCAIVLNDFLPVASTRRRFSAAGSPSDSRLEGQLEKARRLLRGN